MDKLKLTPNVPETIALQFTKGKPVSSQFGGDQILYTLDDGRQFYTTPYVAAKIDALNLGTGEPFVICKQETVSGNRRSVEFEVRHAAIVTEPSRPQAPVQPSVSSTRLNGTTAQVDHHLTANATASPQSNNPLDSAGEVFLRSLRFSLLCAVDAAAEAEQHAKGKGLALRFSSEDVRAMANTLMMSLHPRTGGAKWSN